jgi:predicted glycoside hydrolase/deacetylase ChbG (UPF0249 family)
VSVREQPGTPPRAPRLLIVNADDFGLSSGVTEGVIEGHERGIVTSTSLMVRWPATEQAASYARANPRLSVGLHADLGEWVWRGEDWHVAYEVVSHEDAAAVATELAAQLERFRELVGRDPTHLDSHQHVHTTLEPAPAKVFVDTAGELGVPLRRVATKGAPEVHYSGDFFGQTEFGDPYPQAITVEHLVAVIGRLRPGATELCCHPGKGTEFESAYRSERERELEVLCDRRVRAALEREQVELRSFAEL